MKFRLKHFVFIMVICILFSISAVSAADNQSDVSLNNDLISDDSLEISYNDLDEKLEATTNKSFDDFYDDVKNCGDTFEMEDDYRFNEERDNMSQLAINRSSFVINGNGHVIDGSNIAHGFLLYYEVNITINDLTFTNCDQSIVVTAGNITLNNVNFTSNFDSKGKRGIISISDEGNLILNNCNFNSNINSSLISIFYGEVAIYNSHFYNTRADINAPFLVNRKSLVIENCTFENLSSKYGGAINFKGDYLTVKNSIFRNTYAYMTGGAIVARYFEISIGSVNGTIIVRPSQDWLIDNCEFLNASSAHNGGALYTHMNPAMIRFLQKFCM